MNFILAPNLPNPFSIAHELPLMETHKNAQEFENTVGVHKIFVPSNLGGRLTVGFGHWKNDLKLAVADPHGKWHHPDASRTVRIEIPPGQRGNGVFGAAVHAPSRKYSLFAVFDEIGYAREKDGSALIPWNFWYWPTAHDQKEKSAWADSSLSPLPRYEKAFGVRGAMAWEKEHHNDPDKNGEYWEGHCHNAAPASVLFQEPPPEGLKHNGVHFTSEDLKFFATELFGLFGVVKNVWRLPGTGYKKMWGPLQEQKPSDDPALFGNKGQLIELLKALREEVRDAGNALIMDCRHALGLEHQQVWNQAVYRYFTRYWQTRATDLNVVEGRTTLSANEDFMPPVGTSSGLPATAKMKYGKYAVAPNGSGRDQTLRFQLRFDRSGDIDHTVNVTKWFNADLDGTLLHAPRWALRVHAPHKVLRPWADGNPCIRRDDVLALLHLRTRFEQ